MNALITEEGQRVNLDCPLSEHPNPQFQREDYASLNGRWDFAIDRDLGPKHANYSETIVVPFAVETALSGIQKEVGPQDVLHYRRTFDCPKGIKKNLAMLHFEAVDQVCSVYLNGELLGTHEGGYLPFQFRCPKLLAKGNVLEVVVQDNTVSNKYPRGKQSKRPGGIWYHPTSGIWGSVWLEGVPEDHVEEIRFESDISNGICKVFAKLNNPKISCNIEVFFKKKKVCSASIKDGVAILNLQKNLHLWTPEEPNLYDVVLTYGDDKVQSYFGMREVSKVEHNGFLYPALNGKPVFLSGPLDQGYFPESGLTAPTDQALINDIRSIKNYGFNMIRKHIKVESRRYYYHCDRLGILVMQDFVNIGDPYHFLMIATAPFIPYQFDDTHVGVQRTLGIKEQATKDAFISNGLGMIDLLRNHPSIIAWTIFNEGWGQFDTKKVYEQVVASDNTRLIDANSGWFDQHVGDFYSHHIYFRKVKLKAEPGRILSLSEFGGYSLKVKNHVMYDRAFGYKMMRNRADLNEGLRKLYENEIIPLKEKGLAVAVYTQTTDVEEEINGLMTYDRRIEKTDMDLMRELNAKLLEL